MSKEKRGQSVPKDGKICPLYDKCSVRLHPMTATDNPNMAAHLGFRAFYTFIAWFVLGYKINDGFFLAMCFFVLPVFMDCIKFTPLNKIRKWIRRFEIAVTGALFFISLLGVIGIYALQGINGSWRIVTVSFIGWLPSDFDVGVMWWFLSATVIVTLVDWLCNETKFDKAVE